MKNLRNVIICLVLLFSSAALMAEDKAHDTYRHSFRMGWGTAFSSRMINALRARNMVHPYNTTYLQYIQGMTTQEAHEYLTHYRMMESDTRKTTSSGEIYAAYAYQITPLISVGAEFDGVFLSDHAQLVDGYGVLLNEQMINKLYYLTLMPTVRFTYYRQRVLELYSALGLGYTTSMFSTTHEVEWSEIDSHGFGISANATLFGVNVGNEHWYAEAELGLMGTKMLLWPQSTHPILTSRLFSLAVGYRF